MKTLVVVAHLDDETFGLGGTLLRLCKKDPYDVKIVSLCSGRKGSNKKIRMGSFYKVLKHLGCNSLVYDFDDLTLESERLSEIADIIHTEIEIFKPERVICPSIDDLHQDHVVVSKASRIACRNPKVKYLMEFKIPGSSTSNFNIGVNIESVLEEKIEMCSYYKSEIKDDLYNPCSLDGIKNINKGDGTTFGFHSSELLRLVWSKC